MKILSITAQKPHSTGSGTYLTELIRSFARQGHDQAVVYGVYPDDHAKFPDGVKCYPVYFSQSSGSDPADICQDQTSFYHSVGIRKCLLNTSIFLSASTIFSCSRSHK